jgi:hypothetical protein
MDRSREINAVTRCITFSFITTEKIS